MNYSRELEIFTRRRHLFQPTFDFSIDCLDPQFAQKQAIFSRCRKCPNCIRYRARQWIKRSLHERNKWPRAWFTTLTYADPSEHSYKNVQIWFKRVRKHHPDRLAYICTTETESSGEREYNPHHHLVVYGTENLKRRDLDNWWTHGNTDSQLLKGRSAAYVAKYIQKDYQRIRASSNYGTHTTAHCEIMKNPSLQHSN